MRNLSLNVNIRLSPTPEFMTLVSTLLEGLTNLSSNDPNAPFMEIQEQVSDEPKAIATPKAKAIKEVKASEPTPVVEEENTGDEELSAESLRALVITKAKQNESTKELISTTIKSYGVTNVTQIATLTEDKRRAFRNTIMTF